MKVSIQVLVFVATVFVGQSHAHDGAPRAEQQRQPAEQQVFGMAGNPTKVSRTIQLSMNDGMRFQPSALTLARGETVRFVVTNNGKLMHEMVIGTMKQLKQHVELMKQHPGMEHDEPHMTHVPPGTTGEIVWEFNRPGEFHFACLVAGHFEAGMVGTIKVKR